MAELKRTVHRYESGTYGLTEATRELREAKEQLTIRDDHIADLIQQLNHLELRSGTESDNDKKFSNFPKWTNNKTVALSFSTSEILTFKIYSIVYLLKNLMDLTKTQKITFDPKSSGNWPISDRNRKWKLKNSENDNMNKSYVWKRITSNWPQRYLNQQIKSISVKTVGTNLNIKLIIVRILFWFI